MSLLPKHDQTLQNLASTLKYKSPFISGTIPLSLETAVMFYAKGDIGGRIDFLDPSIDSLAHLAEACDPATFGLNRQDVLDESYRKAGKLDNTNFALKFDVERSGLIETIQSDFLEELDERRPVRAELYKLNVYGEQSFFKPHQDTPRGESMFGSLVLVFPAAHEGGGLVLRHENQEWTFDSAAILSECSQPSIAYIAFYSDVEHEVLPVKSGYRITVTYNLYFDAAPTEASLSVRSTGNHPRTFTPQSSEFETALEKLLEDKSFLSRSGYLGFGLRHQYPVPAPTGESLAEKRKSLDVLLDFLKGSDAIVATSCKTLGLEVSLRVLYSTHLGPIMCSSVLNYSGDDDIGEEDIASILCESYGGLYLKQSEPTSPWFKPKESEQIDVHWVTEITKFNKIEEMFMAWGNEMALEHMYGQLCLIARVPSQTVTRAATRGS